MVGALIGAGMSAAGSIFGGIKSAKAMKKYRQQLKEQQAANQAWYDRRYNEDATQRADAQRLLSRTEDLIKNRNRAAAGTQAVVGGTDEGVAATQAVNNEAIGDTASRITAAGDARKDAIEQQYMERNDAIKAQQGQLEVNKANNIANAVKGVASAAGSIAAGVDGAGQEKKDAQNAVNAGKSKALLKSYGPKTLFDIYREGQNDLNNY